MAKGVALAAHHRQRIVDTLRQDPNGSVTVLAHRLHVCRDIVYDIRRELGLPSRAPKPDRPPVANDADQQAAMIARAREGDPESLGRMVQQGLKWWWSDGRVIYQEAQAA